MDLQLREKTAFITGSTAGIGFATARTLIQEGTAVLLNGRTVESVTKAVQKLQEEFPNSTVSGFATDFSKSDEVEELLKKLPEIDILVNNVGVYSSAPFFETPDDDWYRLFELNVMSGVRLSKNLLPKMLAKDWGRILFVSSECATLVPVDMIPYSITKTAMHAVSRGLAQLTKGTGVTVNTIVPGSTLSEGAERFLDDAAEKEGKPKSQIEEAFFTEVRTSSLLQRFAKVEEVATTITYLCSPLSAATNGAAIKVDGGSMGGIV